MEWVSMIISWLPIPNYFRRKAWEKRFRRAFELIIKDAERGNLERVIGHATTAKELLK